MAKNTEKLVKIKIPRDRNDESDMFISINERTWQIVKGVEVEVPECVAQLLADREAAFDEMESYTRAKKK